ncbi:peroxiredoxin [Candidatus Thorarchaeota archaeon]|nr:MAG: peroxiredoxin [Candidatus Thorarchaeota archaeon]
MLEIGDKAPEIETKTASGEDFKLSDYRGQKIVLYFYPKDFTPGCTAEACSLRDSYTIFQGKDIPIFGISGGDAETHRKFREEHDLPFPILMDEDYKIAEKYEASSRLKIVGMGVKRITYLIDEEGKIEAIFGGDQGIADVKSAQHAEQIIDYWGLQL